MIDFYRAEELVKKAAFLGDWEDDFPNPWSPVVDQDLKDIKDVFVPGQPYDLIKKGSFNKMPMIIGHAKDEGNKLEQYKKTWLDLVFLRFVLWTTIQPGR